MAFSVDYIDVGEFDLFERHYDLFGLAIIIELVSLLIDRIGWANCLDKAGARIAISAVLLPIILLVAAGLSTGTNVHGVFPLLMLSTAPVILLGLIVALL